MRYGPALLIVPLILAVAVFAYPADPAYDEYRPTANPEDLGKTWVEINGTVYGARADELGPIGGRDGYKRIVTTGDYVVDPDDDQNDIDQLLEALGQAEAGETVFLPEEVVIDVSVRLMDDSEFTFEIPPGVTLASDRGHEGSRGALFIRDLIGADHGTSMLTTTGPGARVTGLRLRGPNPRRRTEELRRVWERDGRDGVYYPFGRSNGLRVRHEVEIDNCELFGWAASGIGAVEGEDVHVHHNHFHHNQRRGLGYGVTVGRATALIERNLFNNNRHSIAGTGQPGGGYEVRHNVFLEQHNGHVIDMHGGRDRNDGTNIAGDWMDVHHNLIKTTNRRSVVIRGVPREEAVIRRNWFFLGEPGPDVIRSGGNTQVFENAYGPEPEKKEEDYEFPNE